MPSSRSSDCLFESTISPQERKYIASRMRPVELLDAFQRFTRQDYAGLASEEKEVYALVRSEILKRMG